MTIMKELDALNQEIKKAEEELAIAEGKRIVMVENLKKEFGITPDQIEDRLKKIDSQLEIISKKMSEKYDKLKEGYEW